MEQLINTQPFNAAAIQTRNGQFPDFNDCRNSEHVTAEMPIEVVLGNPAKNCLHVGICRIDFAAGARSKVFQTYARSVSARIRVWNKTDVELLFFKKDLPEEIVSHQFKNSIFRVKTPYFLPEKVAVSVGLKNFFFLPGLYPVVEDAGWLKITFQYKVHSSACLIPREKK